VLRLLTEPNISIRFLSLTILLILSPYFLVHQADLLLLVQLLLLPVSLLQRLPPPQLWQRRQLLQLLPFTLLLQLEEA
jgi:hypothetical protein